MKGMNKKDMRNCLINKMSLCKFKDLEIVYNWRKGLRMIDQGWFMKNKKNCKINNNLRISISI